MKFITTANFFIWMLIGVIDLHDWEQTPSKQNKVSYALMWAMLLVVLGKDMLATLIGG